jgi:hypothetical protein
VGLSGGTQMFVGDGIIRYSVLHLLSVVDVSAKCVRKDCAHPRGCVWNRLGDLLDSLPYTVYMEARPLLLLCINNIYGASLANTER